MSLKDADHGELYEAGKERGYNIALHAEVPVIGDNGIDDTDDVKDVFFDRCHDAEENNRSFTPFEFTAKEINEREDAMEAWESFDEGISDGFDDVWQKQKYMIRESEAKERTRNYINNLYGTVTINGVHFDASEIVETLDPDSFWETVSNHADNEGMEIVDDDY